MSKHAELMAKIKGHLKEQITSDSSKEQIDKIATIDKELDELNSEYEKLDSDYSSLKDSYLESVKNTGFKVNGKEADDIGTSGEIKSMEDIMSEELAKITAKQK